MHIDRVQFPLVLPAGPIRRALKVGLGAALRPVYRRRVAALYAGAVGERLSAVDRLLVAAMVRRHERAGTVAQLAPLQRWLWAGDQAVAFHAQAEARFDRWWRDGASAMVQPLRDVIDDSGGAYHALCEIGCGSGLVLDDLRRSLPGLSHFVGVDLSASQVRRNRERLTHPALRFEEGDATAWVPAHAEPGWVYLTNAGVLEYLPEADLARLLAYVAGRLRPAAFAIAEPVADDYDFDRETRSRPYGAERTFSHHYVRLFRDAGWTVRWTQIARVEGTRMVLAVATAA